MNQDEELTNIVRVLEDVVDRVKCLETLVHFQSSWIEALESFVATQVDAAVPCKTRYEFQAQMKKMKAAVYDTRMKKIEELNPGLAARIDIRDSLEAGEQDWWRTILHSKPFEG